MSIKKYVLIFLLFPVTAFAGVIFSSDFDSLTSPQITQWNDTATAYRCDTGPNGGACGGGFYSIGGNARMQLNSNDSYTYGTGGYSAVYRAKGNEDRGQAYIFLTDPSALSFTSGYQEVYVRQWVYWTGEDGTYDHAVAAKQMRLLSFDNSRNILLDFTLQPTDGDNNGSAEGMSLRPNSKDIQTYSYYPDGEYAVSSGSLFSTVWGNPYTAMPNNQWVCMELHVKLNTTSTSEDGEVDLWINDTHPIGRSGLTLRSADTQRVVRSNPTTTTTVTDNSGALLNGVLVGGWYSNSGANSYQYNYKYIDDVVVSTERIGCGAAPPPATIVTMTASDSSADEDGYTGQITLTCSGDNCNDTASVAITRSGTATYGAGADYTDTLSTPITSFPATITLTPYDDSSTEAEETAVYTGVCTNCSLISAQATIYIADNDGTQTVTVAATDDIASETGPGTGTYRVSRTGGTSGALSINFTMSGSATAGTDYAEISSITISDGQSYADVTLTPIDDYVGDEDDTETAIMTITAGTGYTVGSPDSAIINIYDNDSYPFGTGDIWGEHAESDHTGTATDTYLNSGTATTNNSQTGDIRLYTWPAGTNANTGIIKFDLSSVSTSTTIEAATLYLYMANYDGTETNPYSVSVHKIINHDPTISEATWNVYSTGNNWTSGGGLSDIDTAESTTSIGTGIGTWYSWDVSDMVQDWITTPASNYGMLLKGASTQLADEDRYFAGSLSGEPSQRPVLLITTGSGTSGEAGTSPPGGTGRISIGGSGRMNPK